MALCVSNSGLRWVGDRARGDFFGLGGGGPGGGSGLFFCWINHGGDETIMARVGFTLQFFSLQTQRHSSPRVFHP